MTESAPHSHQLQQTSCFVGPGTVGLALRPSAQSAGSGCPNASRSLLCVLVLLGALGIGSFPVAAQDVLESPENPTPQLTPEKPETDSAKQPDGTVEIRTADTLDTLFSKLKKARSSEAAKSINQAIQLRWLESGSDTVDLLMQRAMQAMETKDYPLSLDILDSVIDLKPTFAEGWNKRATVYYLMQDFGRSMGDIEQTLQREPRHFGALSGLASIFRSLGRDRDALEIYEKTLEIHPRLKNVQKAYQSLLEEIDGRDI